MNWHALDTDTVLRELKTSAIHGLSEQESIIRMQQYGPNSIKRVKEKSLIQVLLDQFLSPVIYLLIAAAAISFLLGDVPEGIAIIIVIFINAAIGFYMEWQALSSMKTLSQLDITRARVMRGGVPMEVPSEQITPGELLLLEAGDIVPADARLIEARQLQIDESALTGESLPVDKKQWLLPVDTILAEQSNMLFKGTLAVKGNARAIVTATGEETELGRISGMVKEARQSATPLEQKLEALTKKLIWLTLFLAVIFFIIGIIQGKHFFTMLQTTIAMAVAAIPEGLPIVATIALAHGMLKMARKNVLVKNLASVETLGSSNVIFTDKTGTLTENRITVTAIVTDRIHDSSKMIHTPAFEQLLHAAVLCNNASMNDGREIGDPLEISLLQWVRKMGIDADQVRQGFMKLDEEPFNSDTRYMGTLWQKDKLYYAYVKGATDEVLRRCRFCLHDEGIRDLDGQAKKEWLARDQELAQKGIRVLGFAYRESEEHPGDDFLTDLVLAGLIGFVDPPQEQVPKAIDECHKAGIRVVMLTGDHPSTALYIARQVHLADDGAIVITGREMENWHTANKEEREKILEAKVFARFSPRQKLDVVTLYQQEGYVAAMTGDGVNDAPALKKADIGIAMGLRGTQIAKETADLVLKDDSFTSIVSAIKQGRIIFENIRKCILFLLSCNLSEIMVVSFSAFLALSSPLTALQILYLNLVTDVFPALALGMSRGNALIMEHPPRDSGEGFLVTKDWQSIITYAVIITLSIFIGFMYCRDYLQMDMKLCNNVVFISLALAQIFHVFNLSSADVSFFKNEITTNRYIWLSILACIIIMLLSYWIQPVRRVLDVVILGWQPILVILATSLLPVFIIRLLKRLKMIE